MLMSVERLGACVPVAETIDLGVLPIIDWYAVLTKSGRETTAEENLINQGYACFHPKRLIEIRLPGKLRKRDTVRRSLYPRYVFAGIPVIGKGQLEPGPIYNTRGVITVLGHEACPERIRREAMERLMRRADRHGVVEITEVPADHLFTEGQVVGFQTESLWSPYRGTISRVDSNGRIDIWIDSDGNHWPVNVHYSELLPPETG